MTATLHVVAATGATAAAAPTPTPSQSMSVAQMDGQMAKAIKAFPAKTAGLGGQVLAPTVLADGTKQFELTAAVVKWEVAPGQLVDAWTYNGTVPEPTMHVNPGDKVKVVLTNKLPESTAIHFHGITTPNAMDGVPGITQPPVDPGQSFIYSWTAQSTPAVGMYHSHQDAVKQVPNGLAGAFLIGDEPLPAGVKVAQTQMMMLNDSGSIGLTINGKSFPATAPVAAKLGDWIEVQYMNEGQMIHPMHLHSMAQLVIAEDGYAVAQPYDVDTLMVAPGQRFTVLIHADNPGTWAWHCHILSHAENDQGMFGMVTALVVKQWSGIFGGALCKLHQDRPCPGPPDAPRGVAAPSGGRGGLRGGWGNGHRRGSAASHGRVASRRARGDVAGCVHLAGDPSLAGRGSCHPFPIRQRPVRARRTEKRGGGLCPRAGGARGAVSSHP
jgi:manganese oxidase